MKVENLNLFLIAARTKNLNKAAEESYVSPQNLGFIIKNLEKELGVTLFTRSNKGLELTVDGEEFQQCAEQMIALYDAFKAKRKTNNILDFYTTPALADELDDLQGMFIGDSGYISLHRCDYDKISAMIRKKKNGIYLLASAQELFEEKQAADDFCDVYTMDKFVTICHKNSPVLKDGKIEKYPIVVCTDNFNSGFKSNMIIINDIKKTKQLMKEKDFLSSMTYYQYKKHFLGDEWVMLKQMEVDGMKINLFFNLNDIPKAEKIKNEIITQVQLQFDK